MGKELKKNNVGRPWFDGKSEELVVAKLEEAAAIDASVPEMCFYADISEDSYFRYMRVHEELRHRIAALREKPVMLARQTAVKKLTDSYSNAMDYLKRKKKLEFGDSTDITTGGDKIIFMPKEIIDKYKLDAPPPQSE